MASYAFAPGFPFKDYVITLYHLCIAPALLAGIIAMRKVYSFAWIGAAVYAGILAMVTYLFIDTSNGVNCVHSIYYCREVFGFLEGFSIPYRIIAGYFLITILFFIPTNIVLISIAKLLKWETVKFSPEKIKDNFPFFSFLLQK